MKFLKHLLENPFITFTGLAALVHSTWSLGTLFSGVAPEGNWGQWAEWVLPAFFIAFAMDVGQISTSAKIRHYGLNWQRALAFFVFSIATYYLQFLYIAHHMPSLEIAAGVSEFHQWAVITARDAAIWILPLLLPLSTMLYTISDGDTKEQPIAPTLPEPKVRLQKRKNEELPAPQELPEIQEQILDHNDFVTIGLSLDNPLFPDVAEDESSNVANLLVEQPRIAEWQPSSFVSECECGRQFSGKSQEQADRALRSHLVYCKKELSNGHLN